MQELELNFNPFPVLQTQRLSLRQITMADAEDFFLLRSNKEAMKYIDKALFQSVTDAYELINRIEEGVMANERISWGISLKENPKLIGTISFHRIEKEHFRAEVGYMLFPEYWNKGLLSEAMKAVLDFGFNTVKLHSIEGIINPKNLISAKLLQKFGFVKEAYFKESFFYNGNFLDTEIYSLLKSDYKGS